MKGGNIMNRSKSMLAKGLLVAGLLCGTTVAYGADVVIVDHSPRVVHRTYVGHTRVVTPAYSRTYRVVDVCDHGYGYRPRSSVASSIVLGLAIAYPLVYHDHHYDRHHRHGRRHGHDRRHDRHRWH
jgi:hypothetical protein